MKILILNGNPDLNNPEFEDYIEQLAVLLREKGNSVSIRKLRDLNFNYCTGCFDCWAKTPGKCVFKDDMAVMLREYNESDAVISASPIIRGFYSYLLKKFNERLMPIYDPYYQFKNDRFVHPCRNEKAPSIGLLLWKDRDFDRESFDIIDRISDRSRRYLFTRLMDNNVRETADAIGNI